MGRRLAILIGNQTFAPGSGFASLRGPHNDVDALAVVLRDPSRGDFELPVPPLKDATRENIVRVIERTLRDASSDDTVLIHYSGHGKPDHIGHLNFAAKDTDAEALAATGVRASDIHELARTSRCRTIILLLDCCYAGAIGQAMNAGIKGDTADLVQQQLRRTAQNAKGLFILTSSTAWQTSEEAEDGHNGLVMGRFTSAVIERLTADAPGLRDEVLFSDLAAHVSAAFEGQDTREFRADAQGDPLIARVPSRETPKQRHERILTGWVQQGAISALVYAYAFEALQESGTSVPAALVRSLLETSGMTHGAFSAAVRPEATRLAEERRKANEAARKAEEQRRADETARLAEEQRKADEAARAAQERAYREAQERERREAAQRRQSAAEQAKAEQRRAEETRKAEQAARQAEEQRRANETARLAGEQRKADEAARAAQERAYREAQERERREAAQRRQSAAEQAKAEQRRAEETRKAEEAARQAEERREADEAARLAEEIARRAEEKRGNDKTLPDTERKARRNGVVVAICSTLLVLLYCFLYDYNDLGNDINFRKNRPPHSGPILGFGIGVLVYLVCIAFGYAAASKLERFRRLSSDQQIIFWPSFVFPICLPRVYFVVHLIFCFVVSVSLLVSNMY